MERERGCVREEWKNKPTTNRGASPPFSICLRTDRKGGGREGYFFPEYDSFFSCIDSLLKTNQRWSRSSLFSPQTFLSVLSLCNVDRVRSCSSLFKPIDSIFFLSLRFYIRRKRACFWSSISFFVEEIRKSVSYAKSSWDRVDVFTILSLVHLQVSLQQVYTATVGDK